MTVEIVESTDPCMAECIVLPVAVAKQIDSSLKNFRFSSVHKPILIKVETENRLYFFEAIRIRVSSASFDIQIPPNLLQGVKAINGLRRTISFMNTSSSMAPFRGAKAETLSKYAILSEEVFASHLSKYVAHYRTVVAEQGSCGATKGDFIATEQRIQTQLEAALRIMQSSTIIAIAGAPCSLADYMAYAIVYGPFALEYTHMDKLYDVWSGCPRPYVTTGLSALGFMSLPVFAYRKVAIHPVQAGGGCTLGASDLHQPTHPSDEADPDHQTLVRVHCGQGNGAILPYAVGEPLGAQEGKKKSFSKTLRRENALLNFLRKSLHGKGEDTPFAFSFNEELFHATLSTLATTSTTTLYRWGPVIWEMVLNGEIVRETDHGSLIAALAWILVKAPTIVDPEYLYRLQAKAATGSLPDLSHAIVSFLPLLRLVITNDMRTYSAVIASLSRIQSRALFIEATSVSTRALAVAIDKISRGTGRDFAGSAAGHNIIADVFAVTFPAPLSEAPRRCKAHAALASATKE